MESTVFILFSEHRGSTGWDVFPWYNNRQGCAVHQQWTTHSDHTKQKHIPYIVSGSTYITENTNWDVVVSDYYCRAVVVTSSEGTHRFSYTGLPSGPELDPRGVCTCTDALSHILVCDYNTATVQMLNRDGQFLCNILVFQSPKLNCILWSLSYDVVGTGSKTVYVYRYIERHTSLIGKYHY